MHQCACLSNSCLEIVHIFLRGRQKDGLRVMPHLRNVLFRDWLGRREVSWAKTGQGRTASELARYRHPLPFLLRPLRCDRAWYRWGTSDSEVLASSPTQENRSVLSPAPCCPAWQSLLTWALHCTTGGTERQAHWQVFRRLLKAWEVIFQTAFHLFTQKDLLSMRLFQSKLSWNRSDSHSPDRTLYTGWGRLNA